MTAVKEKYSYKSFNLTLTQEPIWIKINCRADPKRPVHLPILKSIVNKKVREKRQRDTGTHAKGERGRKRKKDPTIANG